MAINQHIAPNLFIKEGIFMSETEDRRVRKTKKAMYDALALLLSKKPLNSISVREIAELADINRGTFYLHYRDVYDMVDKLQEEIFEKFNRIVDSHEPNNNSEELFPLLVELFGLLRENAKLARVLIGKNGNAAFVDKLKQAVREKCFANARKTLGVKDFERFDYFYQYIVSGCIGIFSAWLNGGMRETPTEMAGLTERLILTGAASLS